MDEKKPLSPDIVDDDKLEGVSGGTEEVPQVITKEDFFKLYGPFMNRSSSPTEGTSSSSGTGSSDTGYKHYHKKHRH